MPEYASKRFNLILMVDDPAFFYSHAKISIVNQKGGKKGMREEVIEMFLDLKIYRSTYNPQDRPNTLIF